MKANRLTQGLPVIVTSGTYLDYEGEIIDPNVVPDGQPNQRKVQVRVTNPHTTATQDVYILPRQIERKIDKPEPALAQAGLTFIERGLVVKPEPITDPMDPALDQFRPDPAIVKEYVSRTVVGGFTDVDYLLHLRDQRDGNGYSPNVALVGDTQSGKTMLVRVLACVAAERDGLPKPYPVITLNGSNGITDYELFGQTSAVVEDGQDRLVWMDGLVPLAVNCGAFLYLDEWNAVPPAQAVALHPVLDDRREFLNLRKAVPDGHSGYRPEVTRAHPNTWVITTVNPGYKGTQTMAEASTNRFRWVPWNYDDKTEEKLVPSATVRAIGIALREAGAMRILSVPVGTSALIKLNEDCASFGPDNALWSFTAMFPPSERERAEAIIRDRGFLDILRAEYPNPVFVTDENQQVPTVVQPDA